MSMKRISMAFVFVALAGSPALALDCFLVNPQNQIQETLRGVNACPANPAGKPLTWRQHVVVRPSFNSETEYLTGPTRSFSASAVTDTWVKVTKTAGELDTDRYGKIDALDVATFRALCHLKNEVRTKVEGLTAWTQAQCRDAFKALLP